MSQKRGEDLRELLGNALQYSALFSVSRFYHHAFYHPLGSLPPATACGVGDRLFVGERAVEEDQVWQRATILGDRTCVRNRPLAGTDRVSSDTGPLVLRWMRCQDNKYLS